MLFCNAGGSDVRADPCLIIRKCSCDYVLTEQITERALPPGPDGETPLASCTTLISASFTLLLYLIYTVSLQLPHQRCCFDSVHYTFPLTLIDCNTPSVVLSISLLVSSLLPPFLHCHPRAFYPPSVSLCLAVAPVLEKHSHIADSFIIKLDRSQPGSTLHLM